MFEAGALDNVQDLEMQRGACPSNSVGRKFHLDFILSWTTFLRCLSISSLRVKVVQ